LHDAGNVDILAAKIFYEGSATLVVADNTYGQHARAEISEIVDGVRGAAGISLGAAVTENQDRRFARNTRNFAGYEFIQNEIANNTDRLTRESGHDVEQAREIDAAVGSRSGRSLSAWPDWFSLDAQRNS
jgi:hypothetical protein